MVWKGERDRVSVGDHAYLARSSSTREQVNEGHEQGRPDDGPQDGEGVPVNGHDEGLWEPEKPGDPGSKQRSDEAEGCRNNEPAPRVSRDGLPDSAANGRDQDEKQQP